MKIRKWQDAKPTERVAHLRPYRWSSYPSYATGVRKYPWLNLDVLAHYGRVRRQAARRCRAYTEDMIMQDDEALLAALKSGGGQLGGDEIEREATSTKLSGVITLSELDKLVAKHFGIAAGELRRHGHAAGTAKRVAMEVATRVTGLGLKEVGSHYGGLSASAVTMNRRRLRSEDMRHISKIMKRLDSV